MIPKIFHFTSKSKILPAHFQKKVDVIRDLYSDYEIVIHDDGDIENFIKKEYADYFSLTISAMPKFIMVVDTVRYMWMQRFGGIYCDLDMLFQKRFEFDEGVIFIQREWNWPTDPSITTSVHNCWFASTPGHPVWQDILDGIARNVAAIQGKKDPSLPRGRLAARAHKALVKYGFAKPITPLVFNTTGPNAISKIISDGRLLSRYNDIRIAPGNVIFQEGMSKGRREAAYAVHETAASWRA